MPSDDPASGVEPVEGRTFSLTVKVLATLLVALVALFGLRVAERMQAANWSASAAFLILAAAAITVVCYWRMLGSRTAIDFEYIRQDFLFSKKVALADITQAKFFSVPHLEWLIMPRLAIRARGRGFFVFYTGDRRVLEAFARLSLAGQVPRTRPAEVG